MMLKAKTDGRHWVILCLLGSPLGMMIRSIMLPLMRSQLLEGSPFLYFFSRCFTC